MFLLHKCCQKSPMEITSFSHFEAALRQKAKEKDSSEGDSDFLVVTFITETMSSWVN